MAKKAKDKTADDTKAAAAGASPGGERRIDSETLKKLAPQLAKLRSHMRETIGAIVTAMMMLPRYRNQTLADLQHLVLEPMMHDRIAIAYPGEKEGEKTADVVGFAIWASVSDEADARIREQIKAGVFPPRLKSADWKSGEIHWLLDVIAPNPRATAAVIGSLGKLIKGGNVRLHPMVSRLVDAETLKKLGVEKLAADALN